MSPMSHAEALDSNLGFMGLGKGVATNMGVSEN